jgi:hypothetical protein
VVVWVSGTRELAKSRGTSFDKSRGAGATTVVAMEFVARILSCATVGAGATGEAVRAGVLRVFAWAISGAGATTFCVMAFLLRLDEEFSSGVGGTALRSGNLGAASEDCKPSAGRGPGFALKARRLATAESL